MSDSAATSTATGGVRQANEIAALRALHRFGRLSRADLARKLRLNRSSSGHIIAGLLASGLVRETAAEDTPAHARVGRPGIMFELVPEAVFFLGVEIGVEHITVVEIDLEAQIVSHREGPFAGAAVAPEQAIAEAFATAMSVVPAARWARCEGVGLSLPGQMDRGGFVRLAPLLGWREVDAPGLVREALPAALPVRVENDANAFAIGATYGRNAARAGVTFFLLLETGVGGGVVIDGALYRGAHGLAGEVGHMRIAGPDGEARNLEELIGLESLLSAYAAGSGRSAPALGDVLARVRDREPVAVAVAEDWARTLASALVHVARVLDPGLVVLGGSLAPLYPLVAARVAAHVAAMQEPSFPVPPIVTEQRAGVGAAYGAACILHQQYLSLGSHRSAGPVLPLAETPLQQAEE